MAKPLKLLCVNENAKLAIRSQGGLPHVCVSLLDHGVGTNVRERYRGKEAAATDAQRAQRLSAQNSSGF